MLVQLVNKKVFIDDLLSYSKVVSRGKLTKSVYDLVLESYNVFFNDITGKESFSLWDLDIVYQMWKL